MDIPPVFYYLLCEFPIFCVIWSLPLFFHSLFDVPFRRIANVPFAGVSLVFIVQDLILWIGGGNQNDGDFSTMVFGSVFVAVILYCLIIALLYYKRIKSNLLKKIVKAFLILYVIFLPGFIWDSILIMYNNILLTPLFYLLWNLMTIYFGVRYLLVVKEKIQLNQQFLHEYDFSKREIEILDLMLLGLSYKKIAEKAFISPATVKTHLHNIYAKTGARNRNELAALLSHYKEG
jgi:DNA-binding CsgD family transcriptional regulator